MVPVQCFKITFIPLIYYVLILSVTPIHTNGDTISTNTDQQYENQTIYCNANEPCNILCQHVNGCKHSEIYCPSDYPCAITCNTNTACANAIIHAQHSSSFQLLDCATGSFTCAGLTIYFPPNNHGTPRAKIKGADSGLSAGEDLTEPLQFYAIYGWNDINITTSTHFSFQYHAGVMYCTSDLQTTCAFDSDDWHCANTNDLCNNPPTKSPTLSPTLTPTISPTQTETTEESNNNDQQQITVQQKTFITPTTLYVIIAMLLVFLCCFGSILLYYMYYSQAFAQKLASSPISRIHSSRSVGEGYQFQNIPSLSVKSGATPNSNTRTSMTSPASIPSISQKNSKSMTSPIKNSDDDMNVSHNNTHNSGSPWSYFAQNKPVNVTPTETGTNVNSNLMHMQMQMQMHAQENYLRQLIAAQQHSEHTQKQAQIVYHQPPQQVSIPSTSVLTSSLSSNQQPILYQQPSQHHMLQMMSMMNQSQPHSLSSFVNNSNHQQPIPPSVSNTPNNSSRYLQPRNNTITSSMKDEHDYLKVRIPPPESVLSGLTSMTATTLSEVSEQNSDPHESDDSDDDDNIYTVNSV